MKIKIFSGDDPQCVEDAANAWLDTSAKRVAETRFAMTSAIEEASEPGVRPKTGGAFIEYGVLIVYSDIAPPE